MADYKRSQYWVNQRIQWPYTRAILTAAIFSGMVGAIVAFVIGTHAAIEASGVGDWSLTLKWILRPRAITLLVGCVVVAVFVAVMAMYGVRVSHRIAGPMVPIQRALQRIREGDFSKPIRIREDDLLHDLVGDLNQTFEVMRLRIEELENKKVDGGPLAPGPGGSESSSPPASGPPPAPPGGTGEKTGS